MYSFFERIFQRLIGFFGVFFTESVFFGWYQKKPSCKIYEETFIYLQNNKNSGM